MKNISRGRFLESFSVILGASLIFSSCGSKDTDADLEPYQPRDMVVFAKDAGVYLKVEVLTDDRSANRIGYGWGGVTIATTTGFKSSFEQRQPNTSPDLSDVLMFLNPDAVRFIEPTNEANGNVVVTRSDIPYAIITSQVSGLSIGKVGLDNVKKFELFASENTIIKTSLSKRLSAGNSMEEVFIRKIDKMMQMTTANFSVLRFNNFSLISSRQL